MREVLKDRVGKRGPFTATFSRVGGRATSYGWKIFVLLVNVRDEAGTLVTDHLWFNRGLQFERLNLKAGDRIRFKATVEPYRKRNPDSDGYEDWNERFTTDYRLAHPSNFCLIERAGQPEVTVAQQETLPLFGAGAVQEGSDA